MTSSLASSSSRRLCYFPTPNARASNSADSLRDADGRRGDRARRRIVRHQAEENLRADAHADAAQAHKKESDRREIALTQANGIAGEISVSKKEGGGESHPDREARAQRFIFAEKEESFSDAISGIFSDGFSEEKEAQIFSYADALSDGIATAFSESERIT